MTKKNIILIIVIVFLTLLFIGVGTYAYWTWTSNSVTIKNVSFSTSDGLSEHIVYNEGDSSFIGNFQPTSSFCQSVSTTLSFYKLSELADKTLYATVYMDINSIGNNIAASNNVHWVITEGDSSISCSSGLLSSSVLSSGTFKGYSAGDTVTLKTNIPVTMEQQTFTVWIWIDSSGSDISNMSGETIDTNVWTEIQIGTFKDLSGTAYAVYSSSDSSLRFYRSETPITVGSTYNGRVATAVYTGFETTTYTSSSSVPWSSQSTSNVVVEDTIAPISTAYWFSGNTHTSTFDVLNLDTSKVTNMGYMFYTGGSSTTTFEIVGMNSWDTSKVTDMSYMFYMAGYDATTWSIGDISNWDTSSVTNMEGMFWNAGRNATNWSLDLSGWDVSNVTSAGNFNVHTNNVGKLENNGKITPPLFG